MAGATVNLSSQNIKSQGIPTNYGALGTLVTVFFSGDLLQRATVFLSLFVKVILTSISFKAS
jgi:hypothetical protein